MDEEILKRLDVILMRIKKIMDFFDKQPDYPYVDPPIHSQVDDIIHNVNELKLEGIPPIARVKTYLSGDNELYATREVVIGKLFEIEGYLEPFKKIDEKNYKAQEPIDLIKKICSKFHSVARQLRIRREGRPTLDV